MFSLFVSKLKKERKGMPVFVFPSEMKTGVALFLVCSLMDVGESGRSLMNAVVAHFSEKQYISVKW